MHPARRIHGLRSRRLDGKRVVLAVSGSIAAVEAVKLAHELIRHGATVLPAMTPSAATIITPLALEYACGRPPVVHLSGSGEHVAWLDGPQRADALLLAPATANTLAKVALGIDDTAVTSMATVALGAGVPIIAAPAMHEVMGKNPAIEARMGELRSMGVHFVDPRIEEGKAKLASPEDIVDALVHRVADGPWKGRKVLVISGSTAEPVDPVRVITNRSSGRMGVELARAAYAAGADVTLWNAWGSVELPSQLTVRRFETVGQLLKMVDTPKLAQFDAILLPAALSDFAPAAARQKISSDAGTFSLDLKPLPKVAKVIRKRAPKCLFVLFKAESDAKRLLMRAQERLKEYRADLVVANTTDAFASPDAVVHLVEEKGRPKRLSGPKSELADGILQAAAHHLRR